MGNNQIQELADISQEFVIFSDQIDEWVRDSGNPISTNSLRLSRLSTVIAHEAADIANLAVQSFAPNVQTAIANLNAQIKRAQVVLKNIEAVASALSVVVAVLNVAVAVASGNPLSTASKVNALVTTIRSILDKVN